MPVPLAFHKIDDRIELGLTRNTVSAFRRIVEYLSNVSFECPGEQFELSFDDGYESVFHNALPILEGSSLRTMIFVIAGCIGKNSGWDIYPGAARFSHLNSEQIRQAVKQGVQIGSHTMTHRGLTGLSDKHLRNELAESKAILEDLCECTVRSIGYPYGRYDRRVVEAAMDCGYEYGYTFFRNRTIEQAEPQLGNMIRQRMPIYLFDSPLSIMLKFGSLKRFESLKGKIVKSYNSLGAK